MTTKLLLYGIYLSGACIGAVFASAGDSAGMRFHGWLILLVSVIFLMNYVGHRQVKRASDYDEAVVRLGVIAAIVWGVIGVFLELLIAAQAAFPEWQFEAPQLSLGRLQDMHSSVMIYAFAGNLLMAASFYIVRRTCGSNLSPAGLAYFVFWGYQLFLLLAVSGTFFGIHQGKIYAAAEWYADFWLLIVLGAYLAVYIDSLKCRKQAAIYLANWFFLAFIVAFTILHAVNSLAVPASLLSDKSYSLFSGVHEAMIQHWFRYNLVGFFLNIGFFGLVYYFLPKATERPLYSYRLAMFHFWCVLFLYGWAAPQSLFHTAVPDWLQNLAVVFGVMLLMPSLGGVINGFMTASARRAGLRRDPVISMMLWGLLFCAVSIAVSGLSSIKSLHIADYANHWGLFGVYFGGLGWAGLLGFGGLYFLAPRLWKVGGIYSRKLVRWHIFLAVVSSVIHGGVLAIISASRFYMEGAYDDFGFLRFGFVDIGVEVHKFYIGFLFAAGLYFLGFLLMVYNIFRTILLPKAEVVHA